MIHSRLGVLALVLGLSGCSQVDKQDLILTAFDPSTLQRAPLAPLASTPVITAVAPMQLASLDSIVENDAEPENQGLVTALPIRTEPLKPNSATFAMTESTSPLMDLANMADWPGYKIKRFLPPPLALTIISIDEIRMALMVENYRG